MTTEREPYTPSTEEIREQYWEATGDARRNSEAWGEFDRWLRERDATKWAEGATVGSPYGGGYLRSILIGNPYLSGSANTRTPERRQQ